MNPRDMYRRAPGVLKFTALLSLALIMLPIIFGYTTFVYKKMWGRDDRMNAKEVESRKYELY